MPRQFTCRAVMLFLLCTVACAGKGKGSHGGGTPQEPPGEPAAPVAEPGARAPSLMLMHLDPPPEATAMARAQGPQPLPEETPKKAEPGAKLPATMLRQLDSPSGPEKAAAPQEKPLPLPEEEKPPR